jgi:putative endonuclease
MPSPTQQRGTIAEDLAARHLETAGLTILARNLRCRCGELDLIARQVDVLVIAEVRQRGRADYGGAAASIGWLKRRRILCATQYFLRKQPEWNRLRLRFDAVLLDGEGRIEWIRHAFDAA